MVHGRLRYQIPLAALIAIALASGGWLVLRPEPAALAGLDVDLAAFEAKSTPPSIKVSTVVTPGRLFADLGNAPEVGIRLDGLSKTARRRAALVSLNGQALRWFVRGQTLDGVTLVDVGANSAVFETREGRRVISLGPPPPPSPEEAVPTPTP